MIEDISSSKIESVERPYEKSNSIFSDLRYFFLNKPEKDTLIKFYSESDRIRYNHLIYDRSGIEVEKYKMLNIHQIGIDTPVDFLFDELMKWNSETCWWPNHIAKVHTLDEKLSHINVYLFGKINFNPRKKKQDPEFHLLRLFNLNLIKKKQGFTVNTNDNDDHYLLYNCSGGYPIGIFCLFVRNSIPERNETCISQLFIMVSFDFYGIKSLSKIKFITKPWEAIHNRVTANSLTRIKDYCELKFQKKQH